MGRSTAQKRHLENKRLTGICTARRGGRASVHQEVDVNKEQEFTMWVASIERGDLGYTYVRLYADAPDWVRNRAINRFGKGTVFRPARQRRPQAA